MNSGSRFGRRKALSGAGALVLAVGLAACSSPGDSSSSGGGGGGGGGGEGLPDTVKLMSINGLTGPVAFAGTNAQKGYDLAIEQIEADGLLGDTTIEIDYRDSAASPQEAASFAKHYLNGRTVRMAGDVVPRDRYGRMLAYVWLEDGTFWNALLAAEGYAQQLTIPPNVTYANLFRRLVSEARNEADLVRILSGVFEGRTTGTPIAMVVENTNARSQDYDAIKLLKFAAS